MIRIGVAGSGRSVGVTHASILTAAYLSGVLQKKTAVLEWRRSGVFVDLQKTLSEKAVTKKEARTFNILGIFFCQKNGMEALDFCTEQGFEAVVIDFGCYEDGFRGEFLHCDRRFLIGSVSDWQLVRTVGCLTGEFARKWKVEYFVSFGAEENLRMAESCLRVPIRRIPFFPDAFTVTGEVMDFFGRFLKYEE